MCQLPTSVISHWFLFLNCASTVPDVSCKDTSGTVEDTLRSLVQLQASIQCGLDYCNTVLVRSWNSWHSDEKAAVKFRICSLFSDRSTTMRPYHYSMQPAVASSAVKNCIHDHSLACTYENFAYWLKMYSLILGCILHELDVCPDVCMYRQQMDSEVVHLWTNSVEVCHLLCVTAAFHWTGSDGS